MLVPFLMTIGGFATSANASGHDGGSDALWLFLPNALKEISYAGCKPKLPKIPSVRNTCPCAGNGPSEFRLRPVLLEPGYFPSVSATNSQD